MREPVATAKQVATIDCLSGGRFVLGVGAGGEFADEWAAVGVPRESRGRRLDHHLALARDLWSGADVPHRGEFAAVEGVTGSPLPGRSGGPPVWVGGGSDAALDRAAQYDGWLGYVASTRRVRAPVEALASRDRTPADGFRIGVVLWTYAAGDPAVARERIGRVLGRRYRQDFDKYVDASCAFGTAGDIGASVTEFRAAGATDILLCPQCPAEEFLDLVERLVDA